MVYIEGTEIKQLEVHVASAVAEEAYICAWSAGHFKTNSKYRTDRSNYPCILVLRTLKGKGKLFYKSVSYDVVPGTIMIIDCSIYHLYYTECEWEFKYFDFAGGNTAALTKVINDLCGAVLPLTPELESDFEEIYRLYYDNPPDFEIAFMQKVFSFLTNIIYQKSQKSGAYAQVGEAVRYIHKNFKKNLSVDRLASLTGLSKYYFLKQFKKATGYTPHSYLIKLRLEAAGRLLISTDFSLEEIACRTGFFDQNHLIKLFKKHFAKTPAQYKKIEQSAAAKEGQNAHC